MDDDVKRSLESLPYDYRMVVILADLEDFSYKEIAEILDCPVGTVMSRLYRGRKLLEKALLKYARQHGYIRGGRAEQDADAAQAPGRLAGPRPEPANPPGERGARRDGITSLCAPFSGAAP